jgi:hypothetical protein
MSMRGAYRKLSGRWTRHDRKASAAVRGDKARRREPAQINGEARARLAARVGHNYFHFRGQLDSLEPSLVEMKKYGRSESSKRVCFGTSGTIFSTVKSINSSPDMAANCSGVEYRNHFDTGEILKEDIRSPTPSPLKLF